MLYNLKKFLLFILISIATFSCSPKIGKYNGLLRGIKVNPEVLSMHQDSVRFQLVGAIPLEYLNKDTKISIFPEYVYGEGALRLGELVAFDGTYDLAVKEAKIDVSYLFPYLPGMDSGQLILKGLLENKTQSYSVPEKKVADGLVTTALLTRVDQITPDEPIPHVGVYMDSEFFQKNRVETREYYIPFPLNNGQLQGRGLQTVDRRNLVSLDEPGKTIQKIQITGLVSPENLERNKDLLAESRVKVVQERLWPLIVNKNTEVVTATRTQDWFDFRLLLSEYSGITASQKEAYQNIILNGESFDTQLIQMQKISTFGKVSKDLFPKLRAAKITVTLQNSLLSDPAIAASVYKLLQDGQALEGFTAEQLVYAGQMAKRLHEKEAIYLKLKDLGNMELALNNLGVVYLNYAHRELDTRERNIWINKAVDMFREVNKLQTSSISMHNLGRAYLLRGDYFEAYVAISEASTLERNEKDEFLRYNEGLRGALDIINGDYKLATIRLNRAPENEKNLFNKGLAYLLANDLEYAMVAFEESIQLNREYGYGFYGLALVASEWGDSQGLFENLEKAVERNEYLKSRALVDMAFYKYRENPEFLQIFK